MIAGGQAREKGSGKGEGEGQRKKGGGKRNANNSSAGGDGERRPVVEDMVQSVPIPANAVGWVMGKGGTHINAMQKQSGCTLRLQDNVWKDFGREWKYISLKGSGRNVDKAKKLIYLSLEKFNPDVAEKSE